LCYQKIPSIHIIRFLQNKHLQSKAHFHDLPNHRGMPTHDHQSITRMKIRDMLCCPQCNIAMQWEQGAYVVQAIRERFSVEEGIIRVYSDREVGTRPVMSDPSGEDVETLGSLSKKTWPTVSPKCSRSIPPIAPFLEVGCGAGNSAVSSASPSVAYWHRRCWDSLRRAQQFKERNGLHHINLPK